MDFTQTMLRMLVFACHNHVIHSEQQENDPDFVKLRDALVPDESSRQTDDFRTFNHFIIDFFNKGLFGARKIDTRNLDALFCFFGAKKDEPALRVLSSLAIMNDLTDPCSAEGTDIKLFRFYNPRTDVQPLSHGPLSPLRLGELFAKKSRRSSPLYTDGLRTSPNCIHHITSTSRSTSSTDALLSAKLHSPVADDHTAPDEPNAYYKRIAQIVESARQEGTHKVAVASFDIEKDEGNNFVRDWFSQLISILPLLVEPDMAIYSMYIRFINNPIRPSTILGLIEKNEIQFDTDEFKQVIIAELLMIKEAYNDAEITPEAF